MLHFNEDGSVTLQFFAIKNDYSRSGFVIRLPPAKDAGLDLVRCLKDYMPHRAPTVTQQPRFPLSADSLPRIKSSTVSDIPWPSIVDTGLQGQGFTPRSFHPTGATAAVCSHCDASTAHQIGHWNMKLSSMNITCIPMWSRISLTVCQVTLASRPVLTNCSLFAVYASSGLPGPVCSQSFSLLLLVTFDSSLHKRHLFINASVGNGVWCKFIQIGVARN